MIVCCRDQLKSRMVAWQALQLKLLIELDICTQGVQMRIHLAQDMADAFAKQH